MIQIETSVFHSSFKLNKQRRALKPKQSTGIAFAEIGRETCFL